jgi:hypothetical protein
MLPLHFRKGHQKLNVSMGEDMKIWLRNGHGIPYVHNWIIFGGHLNSVIGEPKLVVLVENNLAMSNKNIFL